jgi:hypothetical protein
MTPLEGDPGSLRERILGVMRYFSTSADPGSRKTKQRLHYLSSLRASSFDHRGGSVCKPAGKLDGLSGVSFGKRSGVVLGGGLEPPQLRELANGISSVVTGGCQESEGFDVLAAGALADESAGHGIACANPRGHCAAGGDVPSAGVEALTAASSHAFDLDK